MNILAITTKLIIGIVIAIVAVQYGTALFCLMKLAYLDISKKEYVLWNLFILLVFFIGDIVFLVYYSKVKDTKSIMPLEEVQTSTTADSPTGEESADDEPPAASGENAESSENTETPETPTENPEEQTPPDDTQPD